MPRPRLPRTWLKVGPEPVRPSVGVLLVRYGIGIALVVAGLVLLIVNPGGFGPDGFGMAAGSGLSVLMLNWLYRIGVSGDRERDQEERARRFLAEHGRWPDESERRRPSGRIG